MPSITLDQKQCPLCSGNNACGAHDGVPCWCCSVGIPQGLLDLVPSDLHMKACVCKTCVTRFQQDQQAEL
ncbi:MAG: cysteine-rich CWC family protein [Fluviibacter sp.]